MGNGELGRDWLGLERAGEGWRLEVHDGLVSGAGALFGGCATATAICIAQQVADQPVIWAAAHFGALARRGTAIDLTVRMVSSGRTMTHLEISGIGEGDREAFTARVAAGERPAHDVQGQWATRLDVSPPDESLSFDHPVHEHTWADRFEWRLAAAAPQESPPRAAWWVRSREPLDPVLEAAILSDYVTYGLGRALGEPMGGLSIDNVVRIHDPAPPSESAWRLLQIQPESIAGGFGSGHAHVFADQTLISSGNQSVVMNGWDWRLPAEATSDPDRVT